MWVLMEYLHLVKIKLTTLIFYGTCEVRATYCQGGFWWMLTQDALGIKPIIYSTNKFDHTGYAPSYQEIRFLPMNLFSISSIK